MPVIQVMSNGTRFYLAVDTGCSQSCVNSEVLDLLVTIPTSKSVSGVTSANDDDNKSRDIYAMKITIDNTDYRFDFYAYELDDSIREIKRSSNTNINIRGLIGSDFLAKNNLVLDFENKCLRSNDDR